MKNYFTILLSAILIVFNVQFSTNVINAQTPSWAWAKTAGSTGWDYAGGTDYNSSTIATDAQGNSYVTGLFNGTATFGTVSISSPAHNGVFVAKYDINGNCIWAKQFGGVNNDTYGNEGKAISLDVAGNCYVTGTFNDQSGNTITFGSSVLAGTGRREIFVAKYDANGNEQWATQPANNGMANNYAKSISTDASGNSYITGYLGGGVSAFGSNSLSGPGAYVIKYNAAGIAQWATKIGNGNADGLCLDIDNNGNSFVSGYMQGTESFATSPVTTLSSIGDRDVFLAKVNAAGVLTWVKQYGGTSSGPTGSFAYGKGISIDGTGNVFLTGDFSGNLTIGTSTLISGNDKTEAFVAKLDTGGNLVWAQQSANSSFDGTTYGTAIKVNAAGDCYFTGYYYPSMGTETFCGITFPTVGNQITYVLKINSSGVCDWGQFSSGEGSSSISAGISIDSFNNVYIAGNNQGTQVFGTTTITSYGGYDVLIAKLNGAKTDDLATGVQEFGKDIIFNVYPNPFNTSATIDIKGYTGNDVMNLKIYDIVGREIRNITNISSTTVVLDRGDLAKGIYSYKLFAKSTILKTGKLIAE